MADNGWYRPNHKPPLKPTVRQPGEPLWEFRKDHHTYSCELKTD
jgi:hypothetical protein